MIASMRPGAVIIDAAIDQGGSIEGIRETTHTDPVFVRHEVLHLRGREHNRRGAEHLDLTTLTERDPAVPRSSSPPQAGSTPSAADPALATGVNTHSGEVVNDAVDARSG